MPKDVVRRPDGTTPEGPIRWLWHSETGARALRPPTHQRPLFPVTPSKGWPGGLLVGAGPRTSAAAAPVSLPGLAHHAHRFAHNMAAPCPCNAPFHTPCITRSATRRDPLAPPPGGFGALQTRSLPAIHLDRSTASVWCASSGPDRSRRHGRSCCQRLAASAASCVSSRSRRWSRSRSRSSQHWR